MEPTPAPTACSSRTIARPIRRGPRTKTTLRWLLAALLAGVVLAGCSRDGGPEQPGTPTSVAATGQASLGTSPATAASPLERSTNVLADVWWLWALVGLAVGYGVGRVTTARTPSPPAGSAAAVAGPAPDAPGPGGVDPARLVDDLVLGHDLARDEAVAGHLEQLLGQLGVERIPVEPGAPFDSVVHRAVGHEPSSPPVRAPVVLHVVRQGWHAGDRLVRRPEVVVTGTAPTRDGGPT